MAIPTITELTSELLTLVKSAPSINTNGFSVFNLEELMDISIAFPIAGVVYEGASKIENSVEGQPSNRSAALFNLYFTIAVGVNYRAGTSTDTKPVATDLLDELRQIVLGYRGINKGRPWKYTGEAPMSTDMEGVIFYGQQWETIIPVVGNTAN